MTLRKMLTYISTEISEDYYQDYYFHHSLDRYIDILRRVPKVSSGSALEVGCGYGDISTILAKLGYTVYATDLLGDHTRRKMEDRISKYNINFQQNNIEAEPLPFEDCWFDVVIFSEVLEHLNYSPLIPMKELCRVLKNGGRLIISTPNIACLSNIIALLFGKNAIYSSLLKDYISPYRVVNQDGRCYIDRHHRLYTLSELKQLVELAGLGVEETGFSCPKGSQALSIWKKAYWRLQYTLLRLTNFRLFGNFIILVATRRK